MAFPSGPHEPGTPVPAYAGFGRRLAAWLIDVIILSVVAGLLPVGNSLLSAWLVALFLNGLYTVGFFAHPRGQTVGFMAVGIRLVDAGTGGQVVTVQAVRRWLASYLSSFALAVGYLWMLWDGRRQTWHDKLASTVVVVTR